MRLVGRFDPVLREQCARVEHFDDKLAGLIAAMFLILDEMPKAVALAAPQVGTPLQVVVYDLGEERRGTLINPVIISRSKRTRTLTEGCLSFPDEFWRVRRYTSVVTKAQDRWAKNKVAEWHGQGAQMVQHELDHLDGKLIPDYGLRRVGSRET